MRKDLYLKVILTVIAVLLGVIVVSKFDLFGDRAYAITQTEEFQEQFKFILGPRSNIVGNLMVLGYPGKGIYYINLDSVGNFFEGKDYVSFTSSGHKFKLPKPDLRGLKGGQNNNPDNSNPDNSNSDTNAESGE